MVALPFTFISPRTQNAIAEKSPQRRNPCSSPSPPAVYQDLRTHHDWPLKKAIVDLPIRLKENSKRTSGNSLSLLGSQNTDLSATLQTLLTEVKLRLPRAQANLLSGQDKPP